MAADLAKLKMEESNMKLYRFRWDCGRIGEVEGVFIAEESAVKAAVGKTVYFGEILGKHSDVFGKLENRDLTVLSEDSNFITKCNEVFGSATISGYNPLEYLEEEEA